MTERQSREAPALSVENDPYTYVQKVLCTRWKPFIMAAIAFDEDGTRFSRFTRNLPISEKVLAENLRQLESDGLIFRKVYPEVPPRVEYHLTDHGKTACELLHKIYEWGWNEMTERGLPIDPRGEMWHGFREPDTDVMDSDPISPKK
jgi:DNA-binding HxlR family transcriptional regulator